MLNYYQILEIPQTASVTEIKAAFRRLSFKYHPDLNNDTDAEENFKRVNEANQILTDPLLRKVYDERLKISGMNYTYHIPTYKNKSYQKRKSPLRSVSYVLLLCVTVFLIIQAASSLSSVNTLNEYKSNLSKKANEYYLNSQEKNKQIEIIVRRTNSLVDMFRNIPK
ncbi:MAG: DnaJ domain-containing protein [Bacteroidetes bacterium]|nr:DnaJ domain-containing protein [Bacteroidota bacterium]